MIHFIFFYHVRTGRSTLNNHLKFIRLQNDYKAHHEPYFSEI